MTHLLQQLTYMLDKFLNLDMYPTSESSVTIRESSPNYSVETYRIAYCEEINLVPPEDSWIVPLVILEREIPHPYVDPNKPGRRRTKRRRGVMESFQQKNVRYLKILATREQHVRFKMLHNYCNCEITILYLVMTLIILTHFG